MGARYTASTIEQGIDMAAMGVWLAGEQAIANARADAQTRAEIVAHNRQVAAIRAARRRCAALAAAAEAAAVERGQARMGRWLELIDLH
jgi:hypothetical protein